MRRCATVYSNRGLAPEGELLSFASPKESNPRKSDPAAAKAPALLAFAGDRQKGHPRPSDDARNPFRAPSGRFPVKAAVLGAANGNAYL
jgi:hypothetical protein